MTERFHTIDGETLMKQPLAPISFVVDSLLSQGLHILAGAPKLLFGKLKGALISELYEAIKA